MRHQITFIFLTFSFILLAGCGQAEREQKLAAQQKQLIQQQQELVLKANELALKEAKLNELSKSMDSAHIKEDSLKIQFPELTGKWDVTMNCTQATCSGSAVGDTKTESWTFTLTGGSVIAQAYAKNILSRVYIGKYQDGILQLSAQTADITADVGAQINVYLRQANDSLSMTGKRTIIRPDCQIIYNMTLKKH